LVVDQLSVDDPPDVIDAGEAERETTGTGEGVGIGLGVEVFVKPPSALHPSAPES
jgi:hypothetical protein